MQVQKNKSTTSITKIIRVHNLIHHHFRSPIAHGLQEHPHPTSQHTCAHREFVLIDLYTKIWGHASQKY